MKHFKLFEEYSKVNEADTFKPKKVKERFAGCPTKAEWIKGSIFEAFKKKYFNKTDSKIFDQIEEKAYTEMCTGIKTNNPGLKIYQILIPQYNDNDDVESEHDCYVKANGPTDALMLDAMNENDEHFKASYILEDYKEVDIASRKNVENHMHRLMAEIENCKSVL